MLKLNTTCLFALVIVVLIALLSNQSANALNLQPTSQCKVLINGTEANIASIDRPSGYLISSVDPNFNFLINLCNAAPNPSLNLCENNSSAGYQFSKVYYLCYAIGNSANPKVSYSLATGKVTVSHPPSISVDGVLRQLEVSLECDRNAGLWPSLKFNGEVRRNGVVVYDFSGKTSYICR